MLKVSFLMILGTGILVVIAPAIASEWNYLPSIIRDLF